MWCIPQLDAEYVGKMEDVLKVYEKPYNQAEPVVCLDEKPVSLHAEVRPSRPARPSRLAKRDSQYERCGTANVFCAVEPKAGRHFTFATPDRSGFEFAKAKTIHLVLDNLNIPAGSRSRTPLVPRSALRSGADSRFTTRRAMAVG